MASIQLERVCQAYVPARPILSDYSFTVESGAFCTLVGPSGSGKTTILRLIAGLERPSAGKILIGGQQVQHLPPAKRGVAMVFQRPATYPHLTVRENLAFGLRLEQSFGQRLRSYWRTTAVDKVIGERADEVAELLGLAAERDRMPGTLSGGQQQRLALGRALARKPRVLLLDEPFSQLDAGLRSELRQELRLLQRKLGTTVIYVTHDQEEAMTLGDQLAVIHNGMLQQTGTPGQVYAHPQNQFVAGYIGWPSMHFVDGHLRSHSGMIVWESILGSLPVPASWKSNEGVLGTPCVVGFRPDDLLLESISAAPVHTMMKVVLVEMLGYANLVTLERQGWRAIARVPPQVCPEPGSEVPVSVRMESAHLFDSTGKAVKFAESTA
jgi:ABC-type sugar transport system ATPase subunit